MTANRYARPNRLQEKVRRGQLVTGLEIWVRERRLLELMGGAGFDFVHIENEHVANDWETVEELVRTAELHDMTAVYRTEQCLDGVPPSNEIIKALKCGVQIVKVPHVDTPETAREIVRLVRYGPSGRRGMATCDRGGREIPPRGTLDLRAYADECDREVNVWVIVETPEGVSNVDAIMATDGIDAVGFGHQDYATAAGLTDDTGGEVDRVRQVVKAAALRHGKQMWWNTSDPEVIREQYDDGIRIFRLAVDIIEINAMLRQQVQVARSR